MPTDTELKDTLHARGQRLTPQRVLIHRALQQLDRHASADEILEEVSKALPNASLPTVYATLELFEELGIVRRVAAGERAVLYDPRPDLHHHLVCSSCGKVEDLDAPLDAGRALRAARRGGFEPEHAELVVHGLCAACSNQRPTRPVKARGFSL
jgi:Fe2+ or Zn2+ uptake regulation protein